MIGVRYETLRNWTKKGLLQDDGAHGGRHKGKWRDYSRRDLIRLQLAKNALDAGLALETIVDVCNDPELASVIEIVQEQAGTLDTTGGAISVLIWPTMEEAQFMFAPDASILQELKRNPSPVTILNVAHAHRQVASALEKFPR